MKDNQIVGVVFLLENEEGRFLLEQRNEKSKHSQWSWVFPGGIRNANESTLETVIREADEEFGIKLDPLKCKKIATSLTRSGKYPNEIWYSAIKNIKPPFVIGESGGAGWFTFGEIKEMNLGYRQSETVVPFLNELNKINL